jgi:hypothetical protein
VAAAAESLNTRHEVEHVIVLTSLTHLENAAKVITKAAAVDVRKVTSQNSVKYRSLRESRWIVAPYSMLTRVTPVLLELAPSSLVLFDQAHHVQRLSSQRTQSARQVAALSARRIALLGAGNMTTRDLASVITGLVDPELAVIPATFLATLAGPAGPCSPTTLLRAHREQFDLTDAQLDLAIAMAPTWYSPLTQLVETVALLRPRA